MRLCAVVLLTAATLVVSASATLGVKAAENGLVHPAQDGTQGVSVSKYRLLRSQNTAEDEQEERTFGIKSIPGVDKISNFVSNQKLSKWLKKDKDADAVFMKLKLNTAGESIFQNPKFLVWAKYVSNYNGKHEDKIASMFPTLMKQYGQSRLARMLEEAKQVGTTKDVATKLQTEQMKFWKDAGVTTDDIFKSYKLDSGVTNLLDNPGVNIWIRYADEFNPGSKIMLFEKLRSTYSDTALSQILIAAQKSSKTELLASKLQNQQLRVWLDRLEPPENVFKLLMLDKGADGLLANPQLQTWIRYTETYRKENPYARKVTVIDTMMSYYSDTAMSTILKTARTHKARYAASGLERDLLARWATAKKPIEYVTKTLRPSTAAEKMRVEVLYQSMLQAARSS
ncbi:hypothetical protein F441_15107 [Phytophthora nicotianae CJ01A1]|uniref:RxLR effector protein n=5 Tax=Phytophthora nicotianae TaxID=4792 RepID=W2R2M6_PHYN3|nr:hypothetical protein PPTG_04390 [Phytophthora nicotianae INRA-310]ETK79280.1 hypothetical protein L915_14836 [Phytophthora nicotianae]ETO67828.1 hypothetical protein F444_15287 [Phytophthora nicotianae P1976]ETP08979.1 hypothetical protein F441_15107 [Phytophthora nicotianae CJ01A1]KUF76191.1 hypothetical protein AM587_10006111 [Phytophthora nicotianae]ETL32696.1 hypothetical protein L916_14745 [Phytophthora nicotianae]